MSYEDEPESNVAANATKYDTEKAVEAYKLKFKQYDVWREEFPNYLDDKFVALLAELNLKTKEFLQKDLKHTNPVAIADGDFISLFQKIILRNRPTSLKELAKLFSIQIGAGRNYSRTHSRRTRRSRRTQHRTRRHTRGGSGRGGSRRTRRTRRRTVSRRRISRRITRSRSRR